MERTLMLPAALLLAVVFLAVLLLPAQSADAGAAPVPIGPEIGPNDFRISDMGPNGLDRFDGQLPAVAYNAKAHEYLVVWEGRDDEGGLTSDEQEIFGQRLDAATGQEVGLNDFRISDMGPAGERRAFAANVDVVYNPIADEFLVVWRGDDFGTPGDPEIEIFAQRLDGATGQEVGTNDVQISEMGPFPSSIAEAYAPSVTFNALHNEYLVVWHGTDGNGLGMEIYGQRLDGATGAEVGVDDFRISSFGPVGGSQSFPALAPDVVYNDVEDEYLVVWSGTDDNTTGLAPGEFEVFAQRLVGATGVEVGRNDFRISSMGPDLDPDFGFSGTQAKVAYNRQANEYLVVWIGDESEFGARWYVYGQRLAGADAAEVGVDDFRLSEAPLFVNYSATRVDLTYDEGGDHYLVVWQGLHAAKAQRVDGATASPFDLNDFDVMDPRSTGLTESIPGISPAVAYNPIDHELLVVWCNDVNAHSFEIYGQRIRSPLFQNGFETGDLSLWPLILPSP